jgi:hypothetical protein
MAEKIDSILKLHLADWASDEEERGVDVPDIFSSSIPDGDRVNYFRSFASWLEKYAREHGTLHYVRTRPDGDDAVEDFDSVKSDVRNAVSGLE